MKKPLIIAECGNCHEGVSAVALGMISKAKSAGADLVKFQAGTAEGFARTPEQVERYKKYELGYEGYCKLIQRGREIGIPVFFSVWANGEFDILRNLKYLKLAARQCSYENIQHYNSKNLFVSIPHKMKPKELKTLPRGNWVPLHCVTEYPTIDPDLKRIKWLREFLKKPVGYSDHTIGIESCIDAVKVWGATVIEKHFTFDHEFGSLRDHKHAATPMEFAEMVMRIKQ